MFGLSRKRAPAVTPDDFYANITGRVNRLENRLEKVELEHAERQVAVLGALEKVLHQLRARDRQRVKKNGEEPLDVTPEEPDERSLRPVPPSTAHLAQRFRR